MALLLDEEEADVTYVPPRKTEKTECGAAAAAAVVAREHSSPAASAASKVFVTRGGDGLSKMAALVFGAPKRIVSTAGPDAPATAAAADRRRRPFDVDAPKTEPQTAQKGSQSRLLAGSPAGLATTQSCQSSPSGSSSARTPNTQPHTCSSEKPAAESPVVRALDLGLGVDVDEEMEERPARRDKQSAPKPVAPPAAAAPVAAKQMNLSDFFAKMACKKQS